MCVIATAPSSVYFSVFYQSNIEQTEQQKMGLLTLQVVALTLALVFAAAGVMIPVCLKRSYTCVFGTAVAGGVLLGSAIVHLLPDTIEMIGGVAAGIISGSIFLALAILEDLAMYCFGRSHSPTCADESTPSDTVLMERRSLGIQDTRMQTSARADESSALELEDDACIDFAVLSDTEKNDERLVSPVKSLCLLVALSFHSFIEGFTMGTVGSTNNLVPLALALLMHKGLAAFALGETLMSSSFSRPTFYSMAIFFILCSPIGTLVGLIVTHSRGPSVSFGKQEDIGLQSVCIALAAGTFLQISTMELIPRVLGMKGSMWAKHLGLVSGFGAMSILGFYV
eukprot:GEMP01045265.1.p1 GENE.GEMP01045265.1~~GEMP01045265.1.p1  ORF type:complete len:340 (+),score=50.95 GEMP01045265.1:32-1051(+)